MNQFYVEKSPKVRLLFYIFILIFFSYFANICSSIILSFAPNSRNYLLLSKSIYLIIAFFFSSILYIIIFNKVSKYKIYFSTTRNIFPFLYVFLITIFLGILTIPIIKLNQSLAFPSFLTSLENWVKNLDSSIEVVSNKLLFVTSLKDLSLLIVFLGIVPAVAEEIIFRGVLFNILGDLFKSKHYGIISSALIFSILHFQIYSFLPRFLIGILFGYLSFWSGSLIYSIFSHFINNSLFFVIIYLYNTKLIRYDILKYNIPPYWVLIFSCLCFMTLIYQTKRILEIIKAK